MAERTTELRRDIEETRARMTGTVDAIGDRVSPGRVVERRMAAIRRSSTRVRDTVMGPPRRAAHDVRDAGGSAATSLGDAVSSLGDQVGATPQRIAEGTQGNPLAAGAVAFGLGVLLGSLAPPAREEVEIAERALPAIQDEARSVGQAVAQTAKEGAQHAVEETRAAAVEAADTVRERTADAAGSVQQQATDARDEVQEQVGHARDREAGT